MRRCVHLHDLTSKNDRNVGKASGDRSRSHSIPGPATPEEVGHDVVVT